MYIVNGIFENIFQILFTIKIMMKLCALGVKSSVERDWLLCISKSFGRKDVTFKILECKSRLLSLGKK